MSRPEDSRAILSSLPLQVLLYFNGWFSAFFFVTSLGLYIYKDFRYYYPGSALGLEISGVLLFALVEAMRLFMASKGNKTEQINPLALSLGLAVPVILMYSYMLALQTYVLRVDVIVCAIGLVFVGLESVLSVGAALSFYNAFRG